MEIYQVSVREINLEAYKNQEDAARDIASYALKKDGYDYRTRDKKDTRERYIHVTGHNERVSVRIRKDAKKQPGVVYWGTFILTNSGMLISVEND